MRQAVFAIGCAPLTLMNPKQSGSTGENNGEDIFPSLMGIHEDGGAHGKIWGLKDFPTCGKNHCTSMTNSKRNQCCSSHLE